MTVAVQIRERSGSGIPASTTSKYFHWLIPVNCGARTLVARFGEECNRRPSPVVDQQVHTSVFIEITGNASHRRHDRGIVKSRRIEDEWFITISRARCRRDHYLVSSRIHAAEIVWQTITIKIVEGDTSTGGRHPSGDTSQTWVHNSDRLVRSPGKLHQWRGSQGEAASQFQPFGFGDRRRSSEHIQNRDDGHGNYSSHVGAEKVNHGSESWKIGFGFVGARLRKQVLVLTRAAQLGSCR